MTLDPQQIMQREKEADMFALCLLMPEVAFVHWWHERDRCPYVLGRIFGVEPSRVLERAQMLNLPTP